MVSAAWIFFMEAGFFLLEAGAQRKKNVANIMIMNLMSASVALVMWWFTGYAFGFSDNPTHFIGANGWVFANSWVENIEYDHYIYFFFQFAFCTTTTSILSGAVSERMRLNSFLGYCALVAGFVYPVVTAWAWNAGGWLAIRNYHDFAGTGCIHLCGGVAAMWAAIICGPRYQK